MSLVNLSHVCSHLQNASLARLGLTSIPYTRLHLSLALLLHKQGFLSHVKLGGAAPPASAFPAAPIPDNHRITSAPHGDRNPYSQEAALHEMVHSQKSAEDLQREGFGQDSIDFAVEHSLLTADQLAKDGWDTHAINFILEHGSKSTDQLTSENFPLLAQTILLTHNIPDAIPPSAPN